MFVLVPACFVALRSRCSSIPGAEEPFRTARQGAGDKVDVEDRGMGTSGGPAGASEGTGGPEHWDARSATAPDASRAGAPAGGGGPQWPETPPSRSQRTSFIVLAVVLIFVSFVAGIAFLGFGHDWNDVAQGLGSASRADCGACRRLCAGLRFKHPVKVNYLTPADFEKKVTSSPDDLKKQREQIQQVEALLRATGCSAEAPISAMP